MFSGEFYESFYYTYFVKHLRTLQKGMFSCMKFNIFFSNQRSYKQWLKNALDEKTLPSCTLKRSRLFFLLPHRVYYSVSYNWIHRKIENKLHKYNFIYKLIYKVAFISQHIFHLKSFFAAITWVTRFLEDNLIAKHKQFS